jgi:hypothetical protein
MIQTSFVSSPTGAGELINVLLPAGARVLEESLDVAACEHGGYECAEAERPEGQHLDESPGGQRLQEVSDAVGTGVSAGPPSRGFPDEASTPVSSRTASMSTQPTGAGEWGARCFRRSLPPPRRPVSGRFRPGSSLKTRPAVSGYQSEAARVGRPTSA